MKKVLLLIILSLFLTACTASPQKGTDETNSPAPTAKTPSTEYKISDYYPFVQNTRMFYEGVGNEFAEKDVYVDNISGNRIQIRVINPGTTLAQIIENRDGELRLLASLEEFYYRENLTVGDFDSYDILLKEPLVKGTEWTLKDGLKRYISNVDVKLSTPQGEYSALEVITEGKEYKNFDYYARGVGLVKTVFKSGDSTVTSSLKKLESPAAVKQTIKFYYPDFNNDRLVFIRKTLSFNTNDDVKKVFEEYFRSSPGKDIRSLMSSNTKIKSLTLNRSENRVYVDFSKELVSEMNAGTSMESMIIQSITNTLGDYFNVDKVLIKVEGKPYESGHVLLKPGESFYVNYKNVIEYK